MNAKPHKHKEMVEVRGNQAIVNYHPGQQRALESKKRFVFISAGTQGGKTSFAPWWLHRQINKFGPGDYLAVTANYDLFRLKLLPEMRRVFVHLLGIGRYWASERVLEIRNPKIGDDGKCHFDAKISSDPMWARIILRSAQAGTKAGKEGVAGLESGTAKAALLDECGLDDFPYQAWEAVQRRLSLSMGPVLGLSSLYNAGGIMREIHDLAKKGDPDIDLIQFDSIENPAFPIEEYERQRKRLPTWKFNMLYRGIMDRPAGLILSDFDEETQAIAPCRIPPEWKIVVGVDPGPLHLATIWIAEDPIGRYIVFDDPLEGGMTSSEHCAKFKFRAGSWQRVKAVGGNKSEKQYRFDWAENGVTLQEPLITSPEARIDRIIEASKTRRLFVFETCRGLLEEMRTFSRELDDRGQPTEKIKDESKFHRISALGYGLSELMTGRVEEREVIEIYHEPVRIGDY